ncbi:MAG: hypothetical protein EXR98_14520 [Gemmataceae bacterium]|nr:hypothetical protein [Gemmataceae bacterium]
MKKWLRRTLLAAVLVALPLGILYELATHVGRGWINGEAWYEGRPTSYWRAHCDEWLLRFDTAEEAARWQPSNISVPFLDGDRLPGGLLEYRRIRPRPDTFLTQIYERFRSQEARMQEDWPPRVLFGYPGAEPVLEELVQEEEYRLLAERALRYAKVYRTMGNTK